MRTPFNAEEIQKVPEEAGVFCLFQEQDLVYIGRTAPRTNLRTELHHALKMAMRSPYVVQERASIKKVSMPTFSDRVRMDEMFVDFNPFLFHNEPEGALIRLSSSSLLNVTSGGGQTALLVLEDM